MKPPSSSRYVLFLLLAVNLLNYIDRQVIYAVFPLIKADLAITDTELGTLGSAFMLSYMLTAPLFGWLGDSFSRTRLAAGGLFFWSIATATAGLTRTYHMLLIARTAVGVGEASFGTVSPGLLADYFSREKRGRILSYFYLAIPVGSAIGYLAGGVLGHHFGWQAAFLMVGLPGLLLVLPVLFLREPEKSGDETEREKRQAASYKELFVNRSFILNTLSMAAMTFALGGLAQWLPSFLNRFHHLDVAAASMRFGGITVIAGITGTLAGGWLGDLLQKKSGKGYLLLSGWGLLIGAPISYFAIAASDLTTCLAAIFFAEFFLFLNTGPLNTVIVNVTRSKVRAMAFAVNIFFIHALGDAISPAIIGKMSDLWGLRQALFIAPVAIAIAGIFCFFCGRFIEEDSARAENELG